MTVPVYICENIILIQIIGANYGGHKTASQPTSYDYNAPLSEAGDPRSKLTAIRNVISKVSVSTTTESGYVEVSFHCHCIAVLQCFWASTTSFAKVCIWGCKVYSG